jgi:hypothetical protein
MKNSMKKLIFTGVLTSLAVFGFVTSGHTSAQTARESASGQGTLLVQDEQGNTVRRKFSLSAHRQQDGTVMGNAVLNNPAFRTANGQQYQLQVKISCMKVIGNVAFFGGLTRRTNDNDPNLDEAVYFSVQDNGEPGKNRDMISRVFFFDDDPTTTGDPQLCQGNVLGDFPMEPIDAGNIQLRQ